MAEIGENEADDEGREDVPRPVDDPGDEDKARSHERIGRVPGAEHGTSLLQMERQRVSLREPDKSADNPDVVRDRRRLEVAKSVLPSAHFAFRALAVDAVTFLDTSDQLLAPAF